MRMVRSNRKQKEVVGLGKWREEKRREEKRRGSRREKG